MMKTKKGSEHLHKYIVEQDSAAYTPIEQATWRFILRLLADFFKDNAHPFYFEGLKAAGITSEQIPSIQTMRESLSEYGWKTVPVSGFIPPAAFLEMQALGFLPVAKEIRVVGHIPYTPAPDIIHEAAGHAPFLANPTFSDYLHAYADIAKKAIISSEDIAVYAAIRNLSDVKENPSSTKEDVARADKELTAALAAVTYVSEAAKSSRLYWWTAEYGLVGDLDNPKIYGAGILSSIGEAKNCLQDNVKKLPLSVDCTDYNFNITEPQPQLFVCKEFSELKGILQEMAATFSYQRGGKYALNEVIRAKTINSIELNSGLQISGTFSHYLEHSDEIIYVKNDGPSQLSLEHTELDGHGNTYHGHGYSTVLERPIGANKALHTMNANELKTIGIEKGKDCKQEFASGILLNGFVKDILFQNDKALVIVLENCSIEKEGETLFAPEWGIFDWGLGENITAAFSGPADFAAFGDFENFHAIILKEHQFSEQELRAHKYYQKIRDCRQNFKTSGDKAVLKENLQPLFNQAVEMFDQEWLAKMELYELFLQLEEDSSQLQRLKQDLEAVAAKEEHLSMHIHDSFAIAKQI